MGHGTPTSRGASGLPSTDTGEVRIDECGTSAPLLSRLSLSRCSFCISPIFSPKVEGDFVRVTRPTSAGSTAYAHSPAAGRPISTPPLTPNEIGGGVGSCKRQSAPGVRPLAYAAPAGPAVPLGNNNGKLLSRSPFPFFSATEYFPLRTKIQAA